MWKNPTELLIEAEKVVSRLPESLRVKMKSRQGYGGSHNQRISGSGENFWQYREYSEKEPAENIDWRKSARSEKVFVREHEEQKKGRVWFYVDGSKSMDFTSSRGVRTKQESAELMVTVLSLLLVESGEIVSLVNDEKTSAAHKSRMTDFCARLMEGSGSAFPKTLPQNGRLIYFSDFCFEPNELAIFLEAAAGRRCRVYLVSIHDLLEENFDINGRTKFIDPESGNELEMGEPEEIIREYQVLLRKHNEHIHDIAAGKSAMLLRHITSDAAAVFLEKNFAQISAMLEGGL